jgi:hypothetical protein
MGVTFSPTSPKMRHPHPTSFRNTLMFSHKKASQQKAKSGFGTCHPQGPSTTFDAAMKKPVLLLLAGSLAGMSFGQDARLVLNSSAFGESFIVFGAAPTTTTYLVVNNPATNAITQLPAVGTGNIKSEHQNNRIRWRNNGVTGVYNIPWISQANLKIPFTIEKVTAGTGAHDSTSFVLSTFNHLVTAGAQWDNTLYLPTGVTHMNDFFLGSPDNSMNAVNRFWIVDPKATGWAYTTAPDAEMTFVNDDGIDIDIAGATPGVDRDAILPGSNATPTQLQAQRFNPGLNKWGDYQSSIFGTFSNYAPNSPSVGRSTVSNVEVNNANFYRSWTLSNVDQPLPIELTNWNGECTGEKVELTWTTSTETGNAFFTIEKSATGDGWEEIARVEGAGTSTSSQTYTYFDEAASGLSYYRLSQTDIDGRVRILGIVAAGCNADNTEIVNAWDDGAVLNVTVSSTTANVYDVILTDAQGKVMVNQASQAINKGFTPLRLSKNGIATGLYVITLQNADHVMTRRVFLH